MRQVISVEIRSGKKVSLLKLVYLIIFNAQFNILFLFRIATILKRKNVRLLPTLIYNHIVYKYGCFLSLNSEIGLGLKLPHPNGIVIGEKVIIGSNCTIFQQVTIGGKRVGDVTKGHQPRVGDNVTIFAGAKLIGDIIIGDHSTIGANSVVNRDVPSSAVVAGVPARIISREPC